LSYQWHVPKSCGLAAASIPSEDVAGSVDCLIFWSAPPASLSAAVHPVQIDTTESFSGTRIFSTRCATPSCRPSGSNRFGRIESRTPVRQRCSSCEMVIFFGHCSLAPNI
jgi:hypothetical protein